MSDGITDMYRERERFNALSLKDKKKELKESIKFWKGRLKDEPKCKFYIEMHENTTNELKDLEKKRK